MNNAQSPAYQVWHSMRARCTNPSRPHYARYGGRGIKVCARWGSFANFIADMGERPSGATLDRIDNDGHYEPGNCRWATRKDNCRNRANNRLLTFNGETKASVEWAEITGIGEFVLSQRLARGWSVERALTQPPRKSPSKEQP
ncbi:MAG: hypothetical protein EPN60_15100 [Nevskiaceae bacterium]|nr:MAG: hypothetical protein EPN60_15100 [Nevskiaceae bacterium]